MSDSRRTHAPKSEYDKRKRTRRKLRMREELPRHTVKSKLKELSHEDHD